jgi:hypothetical protein
MSWLERPSLFKLTGVSFALAASLAAQQSPASDPASSLHADAQQRAAWATEWLQSSDPRRLAWGAWLAKQDRQTSLIPLLNEKVAEYQSTEAISSQADLDRHDSLLAVLDALISLHAPVPGAEAHKLYPEFPAQSLILLVRSPQPDDSALLDVTRIAKANWNWWPPETCWLRTARRDSPRFSCPNSRNI